MSLPAHLENLLRECEEQQLRDIAAGREAEQKWDELGAAVENGDVEFENWDDTSVVRTVSEFRERARRDSDAPVVRRASTNR